MPSAKSNGLGRGQFGRPESRKDAFVSFCFLVSVVSLGIRPF